jgi:phosphoribosylglycinamide formyltransferase-1
MTPPPRSIAVFASGAGSNARQLIRHFRHHPLGRVTLVACNRPGAGVLSVAEEAGLPVLPIEKERFFRGDAYVPPLLEAGIELIVLAGFLWKVPPALIAAFPRAIVNIHPALLPKYGGKGMYGSNVHAAVLQAGDAESGITIHYVDEHYDSGDVIFQATCHVLPNDTPETLASRVHALEHLHYPAVVEELLSSRS